MIIINSFCTTLDINNAMAAIDQTVASGVDRRLLRIRVSPAQRHALILATLYMGSSDHLMKSIDTGSYQEYGTFCGIPYFVDSSVPINEVHLEKISTVTVCKITELAVPAFWQKE